MSNEKQYPYGIAISKEIFPMKDRPTGQEIQKMCEEGAMIDAAVLQKYSVALHEVEMQVSDMQLKYPFLPENFGFIPKDEDGKEYTHPDGIVELSKFNNSLWIVSYKKAKILESNGEDYKEINISLSAYSLIKSSEFAKQLFEALGISDYVGKRNKTILDEEGTEKVGEPIEVVLKSRVPQEIETENNPEEQKSLE